MNIKRFILIGISASLLSGCSSFGDLFGSSDDTEVRAEGERISVLQLQKDLEFKETDLKDVGFSVPDVWQNDFWPQAGGYPNHALQHLAFTTSQPGKLWERSIGSGSGDLPLTAQPLVVAGVVFTLDSENRLKALKAETGREIWSRDVENEEEDEAVISGGMAFSNGLLYVTNGFRDLLALNPSNGEEVWRSKLPASSRAAPSALDGRVFVITMDSRLLAFDANDGTLLWDQQGFSENTSLLGSAAPAVNRNVVIPTYSSGEIYALRVENGSVAWSDNLASVRRVGALSSISDIKALPVIDRGIVYAVSYSGRMVAIDQRTGQRIWQREIGGSQTPWVAGNLVFVITKDQNLVALERETGAISWVQELPAYDNPAEREDPITWLGPVLAGGRLMVFSSQGVAYDIDPQTGTVINNWETGAEIHIAPVLAKQTLYLLSDDGTLYAYR